MAAANALFDKAIQLDPSYPASYFYRSLAESDPARALQLLNDCIKADSKFHEAYQSLAQLCIQRGELDEAVSYYDKVIVACLLWCFLLFCFLLFVLDCNVHFFFLAHFGCLFLFLILIFYFVFFFVSACHSSARWTRLR